MVTAAEADDDSFVQVKAKRVSKKGDGFDGFGAPDPYNQNDDDEVDQNEPNAPEKENPNEDANMVSGDGDDDSFLQVSSEVFREPEEAVTIEDVAQKMEADNLDDEEKQKKEVEAL